MIILITFLFDVLFIVIVSLITITQINNTYKTVVKPLNHNQQFN